VADVDSVQLEGLTPDTAYAIFLFALHGAAASDPIQDVGVTRTYPDIIQHTTYNIQHTCTTTCC